ncbi:MAG: PEP-CTERM sorting domain-containing protein [Deltaproteobacteria bacterium]|nr:PEP-CTERM sorting domain-containing protein [Deltaproteobacteria bacterium]MBW2362548.1 PEP-CTERM sorting domain-containing protein [Deltaproteobacteria bacterium]
MGSRLPGALSVALLTLGLLLPGLSASALTVTLNGSGTSYLTSTATDVSGPSSSETVNPAALPYSYTSTNVDGGASSESVYALTNAGFDITLDHSRVSALNSSAISYGNIRFSVDQNIDYVASGSYSAVDSGGRQIYLNMNMYDVTASATVFQSFQLSEATPNESFTLGGSGGDSSNQLLGSLTGTLIAGHEYSLNYNAFIKAYPTASTSGATASGSVSLTFIPEPSTALLLGLGLIGFGASRRRR